MNIDLLVIGKSKTKWVAEGIAEYLKRLSKYVSFTLTEIPDVKNAGKISEQEQKGHEGDAILKKVSPQDYLILLDERGRQFTSRGFALHLQELMLRSNKKIIFVIGGPYGFSDEVYARSQEMLGLSEMTFNHEMIRVFIVEQLYRAFSILNGSKYHHD